MRDESRIELVASSSAADQRLLIGDCYGIGKFLDRNPRPNLHHVQTSCFAENYAVGARCDAYIDVTPKAIGKFLSERIRAYYRQHQPPRREEAFTDLPTSYTSMASSCPVSGPGCGFSTAT
ncbi:hypothetical protein CNMCM5793_004196 [Aspergillus hiratsukae]|uniref:Uncharacterized protein n=1 Tax=Aspergillus hiratsukae TaxID=1194566 RepID=A0A8H6QBQ0_9EURO|nr:hypothetical protein CNMCM5793_004196 [Aspergillus hiratsukae]KAF7169474.1 hypothetical protein CNMCM6106_004359 [Aspergillus hiratsukae]